ncbi:hybrid sensor histidine kinase/response regulator [Paractinoplanes abujensis]|uniref:histidine kinase n=1 Tax=Paractinoplanes abujensis TaxID=882441 RepID=A0A7W7FY49_9ACTN|nr:response regulator [Actinoplanes abujensis]MBB4690623.1 two-component system chemotaxis sensor kinase CheA [Actinoplanes abujensis]
MTSDPLRYFRIEARELIDQISAGVLDLDQQPGTDQVARLLRFAHTLKGAARVVKQQDIADRAHEFEEVLVPHRDESPPALPADEMRELLRLNDEIAGFVDALSGPSPTAPVPLPGAAPPVDLGPPTPTAVAPAPPEPIRTVPLNEPTNQAEVDQANAAAELARGAEAASGRAPERAATADLDELLDAIGEASSRIAPLRDGGRTLAKLHRTVEHLGDRMRVGRTTVTDAAARTAVRRLAGELGALGRRLTDAVDQVERELDEVRGRAEGLRLVPAGSIFTALRRAVRDAADAEGKRVNFHATGADVRMGPNLLNLISGAFLHVVRNAVVHGIEAEDQRLAAGKPAEGTVGVHVERRGRYAEFRCSDDGRGFDLAALRRTAEERGLLRPGADAGPQALIDLVLHGGISTAPGVTEVAGRGIGMDVARDVAAQLGGEVSIDNRPGQGATVRLVVPLTLLSMNGLIVEAGGTTATMPLDAVRRCVRLAADEMIAATATARLAHEGEVLPFLPLAGALHAVPAEDGAGPGSGVAVVLAADRDTVAIGVDRLAGITTLVARPLPDLAPAAPVIASVSIDLDGNPRLVLDAHGLVAEARQESAAARGDQAASTRPKMPILVVDDSLTTRMLERSILESAGYEVDLAASGEEGLERARSRDYGLYLSDIDMPGIDGFTFVARAKADPQLAHVPAILVSSRASAEDKRRGAEVGAAAYVIKGEFNQEELLAHIRRLIL